MLSYPSYEAPGTVVLRKDLDHSKMNPVVEEAGGYSTMVQRNYQCLDTYSDDQWVELLDYMITVWAPSGRSATETVNHLDELGYAVELLKTAVDAMCPHEAKTMVRSWGNCDTEYTCDHCGDAVRVDSSD